ncbi:hypothetical protein NDU88_006685 [Pleurodeles waltl]|uniref:Uncharacterized protein n=1 Tax=Pleurodeles waltl TaxID=8319 RepID=A0AAV7UN83_PLEWA|nr:hypothetical protein NDU88_006685 [Pleurodeles waltl]
MCNGAEREESFSLVTRKDFFEEKQLVTLRAQHQMAGCAQHVNLQRLMPRTDVHWTIGRKTARPVDGSNRKRLLETKEQEGWKWHRRAVNISTLQKRAHANSSLYPRRSTHKRQSLSETQSRSRSPKTTDPSQLASM